MLLNIIVIHYCAINMMQSMQYCIRKHILVALMMQSMMINMCFAIWISRVQISWKCFVPRMIIHDWDKCLSDNETQLNSRKTFCHFAMTHINRTCITRIVTCNKLQHFARLRKRQRLFVTAIICQYVSSYVD